MIVRKALLFVILLSFGFANAQPYTKKYGESYGKRYLMDVDTTVTDTSDTTPPTTPTIALSRNDTDSTDIAIDFQGDTDIDSIFVRGSNSAYPSSKTAGDSLYTGTDTSAANSITVAHALAASGKYYARVYVQDEVPNSANAGDSLDIDEWVASRGLLADWSVENWSTSINLTSWNEIGTGAGDSVAVDSFNVAYGSYACRLVRGNNGCDVRQEVGGSQFGPGDSLNLKFRVRGDGTRAIQAAMYDRDNGAWIADRYNVNTTGTSFTEEDTTVAVPLGCDSIMVNFNAPTVNGFGIVDSIVLSVAYNNILAAPTYANFDSLGTDSVEITANTWPTVVQSWTVAIDTNEAMTSASDTTDAIATAYYTSLGDSNSTFSLAHGLESGITDSMRVYSMILVSDGVAEVIVSDSTCFIYDDEAPTAPTFASIYAPLSAPNLFGQPYLNRDSVSVSAWGASTDIASWTFKAKSSAGESWILLGSGTDTSWTDSVFSLLNVSLDGDDTLFTQFNLVDEAGNTVSVADTSSYASSTLAAPAGKATITVLPDSGRHVYQKFKIAIGDTNTEATIDDSNRVILMADCDTTLGGDSLTVSLPLEDLSTIGAGGYGDSLWLWVKGMIAGSWQSWGDSVLFILAPDLPSSFLVTAIGDSDSVNVAATGFGTIADLRPDSIRIQYRTDGTYPTDKDNGTNLWAGSDTTAINNDGFSPTFGPDDTMHVALFVGQNDSWNTSSSQDTAIADAAASGTQAYTDADAIYDFDNDATDSKNSYDLTPVSITYDASDKSQGTHSVDLDGSTDYFTLADNAEFNPNGSDYFFACWFKMDDATNNYFWQKDNSGETVGIYTDWQGYLNHSHQDGWSTDTDQLLGAVAMPTGAWFHLAISYDFSDTEITVWLSRSAFGDSLNASTFSKASATGPNPTTTLFIGAKNATPDDEFDGHLDEVVWCKGAELSAADAQAMYNKAWRP